MDEGAEIAVTLRSLVDSRLTWYGGIWSVEVLMLRKAIYYINTGWTFLRNVLYKHTECITQKFLLCSDFFLDNYSNVNILSSPY